MLEYLRQTAGNKASSCENLNQGRRVGSRLITACSSVHPGVNVQKSQLERLQRRRSIGYLWEWGFTQEQVLEYIQLSEQKARAGSWASEGSR